jgi:hypothetical protein
VSLWDFAGLGGSESLREADYASVLASALLAYQGGIDLALTPGAGLIWDGKRLRIVTLVDGSRAGLDLGVRIPLNQSPIIAARVADALRGRPEWTSLIDVLSIKPPERQVSPGGPITGPSVGTIGTQVTWNSGRGFVTAGHVAPSVHATVVEGHTHIGAVAWSNDPTGHGTAIEPDLAVIELLHGVTLTNPIARAATAGPAATINILSSKVSGIIMGMSQFLFMPRQNATCGDTYFTTGQITLGGDSGGPVMLGTDVIGHVVGASPGVTTFIQDVHYQLREAANPLRAGLLGLRI